jgi:uncharacterized membrane protein
MSLLITARLPGSLPAYQPASQPAGLPACQPAYLPAGFSGCLLACLSACPSAFLSVLLSAVCLSAERVFIWSLFFLAAFPVFISRGHRLSLSLTTAPAVGAATAAMLWSVRPCACVRACVLVCACLHVSE